MSPRLVLWRHADAGEPLIDRQADLARSLSATGRAQATAMARWMSVRLHAPVRIFSSPAARARQTAAALAPDVTIDPRLAPDVALSSYRALVDEIGMRLADATIVIVGHQPLLGALAADLLVAKPAALGFAKAACWWIRPEVSDSRRWTLELAIGPAQIEPLPR